MTSKIIKKNVRTFWQVTPAHKKKIERLARDQKVSESQIIRNLIGR